MNCVSRSCQNHVTACVCSVSHQERGARYGEGLFVEVGAAEQQQDVAVMFSFIKLEHLRELPQLVQVRRELQPAW